jgi:hypothetical protein
MSESLVVSGLVAKRSELAGEVDRYRQELKRLADELGHVDATIRLFDPSYDLSTIRIRKRGHRHQWFGQGECQRLVLEVLREAATPLSGNDLTHALLVRKGLEEQHEASIQIKKTASAVLRRLLVKGVVSRSALPDGTRVWALSDR